MRGIKFHMLGVQTTQHVKRKNVQVKPSRLLQNIMIEGINAVCAWIYVLVNYYYQLEFKTNPPSLKPTKL